jgi:hypothetical protein
MLKKIKNLIKNKTRKDLKFAFKSVGGHNYYYIVDLQNQDKAEISKLPFVRYKLYSELCWEFFNSLKNEELQEWITQCEKINDIKIMRVALEALKFRREMAINVDLIYEILAVVYLRADDSMGALTSDQIKERALDIKNTAETGHFFFHYSELYQLLNFTRTSEISWQVLILNLEKQRNLFRQAIKDLTQKNTP